ncbi:hypothetical protein NEF87_001393 [Candidatus Lokiarchaeum ossiferum]|uniref:N-acetyltransferase domain-containing protein n=1 Tax=Candidatus Lokiarchaeum ossiferum TaxID=2951803 RepID=A0ABY6HP58_9ARCH|nr:hypothetical protein NEF87_001393 [Candidatus Lokiarchaeum sp. B-35]
MGIRRNLTRKSYRKKHAILGENIILKKTGIEHTRGLYEQVVSPGVMDNLTINIDDIEEFRRYIIFITNQWKMNQDFTYTIIENKTQMIVGQISIYNISFSHKRGEIGIWIGNSYWKRGYGSEALHLITDHAFGDLFINRLQCHIFTTNQRSIALFEKMDFQREGLNRQFVLKEEKFRDVFCYSLLAEQWEKKKKKSS